MPTYVVTTLVLALMAGGSSPAAANILARALDLSAYFGRVTPCVEGQTTLDNTCTCLAGRTGFACAPCAAGTYKDFLGTEACVACPVGKTSFAGAATTDDCLCSAGRYYTADACVLCLSGTYKSFIGNHVACVSCPPHSETASTGQDALTDCKCSPGYTGADGGLCTECPLNTYKASQGSAPCSPCPANSVTLHVSATDSTQCVCAKGHYLNGNACDACTEDTYKDQAGDAACLSCADHNAYSSTRGQTGSTSPCQCVCDAGYQQPVSCADCSNCPLNHYCPGDEAPVPCPTNSHTVTNTPSLPNHCICDAQYWKNGAACQTCTPDYFCDGILGNRQRCPGNSTAPAQSASVNECTCAGGFEKHINTE